MEKPHITFSNQWQLRRILAVLLTVAMTISLFSATAYACDSIVENCTSNTTINCESENASYADKEKTAALSFAGGCGTESDPYQIATAKQLDRVRYYLDKHFILIDNIDLSGYENWEPIGTFQPLSDDPEDEETPDPEVAFSGTFDGNGHTISNLTINQPEGMAVGLFGCAVGDEENPSSISNLTVKNVDVTGSAFVGGVVGVQYLNGNLERLSLTGKSNTVRGNANVGGITGGSLSDMKDCDAAADIVLRGDGANHAGVLSGGLEDGSLLNCTATGTVTAEGDNRYGVGGLAGCVIEGEAVTNCHANGVTITALGENNAMIGGLLGHTGASDAEHKTQVTGCSADITITVSDSTSRVGGLVGSGFYLEQYKEYYPTPTMYRIANCSTSGRIIGGSEAIGSIAGHAYNSIIENCTSTITTYCASENVPQVGKEETGMSTPTTGILVVAHGSSEDEWNQPVRDAVEGIDCPYPVELGFLEFVEGEDIGTAVASLEEQGVEHIITVPIFVASASGHIEEIKYILGIPSSITEEEATEEGLEVVSHSAEIEMTLALDDHPLVAEILGDRIATVSQQADQEIVVLVAHGTSEAEDLAVWKNNLASLGQQLKENYQFLDVDYGFVALGEPNARAVVEAQQAENPGASIIVMPVMLSEGTFTGTRIPEVLTGLTYVYPAEGQRSLLPHDKISQLIVTRACDATGVFAGGNGTEESPYQIATAEQLDRVRNYLDKDFVLTADIDLSGYENWEPIGTFKPLSDDPEDEETPDPEVAFTGTFNGNGHTISNLTIDQPEGMEVGLFGCTAGEQESPIHIYDITVENVNVIGNFCVGGVVGFQYADSILENIILTGDNRVQGNIYVGGILGGSDIGSGSAELRGCNVAADIVLLGDNANSAGVLGGALNACSVIDCTATGTVTAEGEDYFALGGLIGGVFEGIEVINCHANDVSITACGKNNTMVGGLLGYAGTYGKQPPTQVTECSADVIITVSNSTERVGGLVGGSFYHELAAEARPVPAFYAVTSCSTSGSITGGGNEVGSIAGYAYDSTVENCTSTMTINRVSENVPQVGLYESAFASGNGTEESPYQIATPEQLDRVRYYLDKHFVLIADIDLSGYGNWTPIGTFDENIFDNGGHSDIAFSGIFDGNGHTVSNLTATHQDLVGVGLFGVASSDAVIKNLTVENASVTGYMSAAGIIGLNCGSVENLALKGENRISGVNCIGGIIGGHGFGSVKNCTVEDVTVNVLGDNDFSSGRIIQCDVAECGGLIIGGAFTGSIENCSARGEIIAEGNEPVGLGGIGGCLEYMENITGCTADVTITAPNSAHAVGGLCGYAGTGDTENPAVIENCSVKFVMNTANATHIGGLVGTGLYYMGMETVFSINNCTIEGQINGAVTPGAIAGRAENCTIGSEISYDVKLDGNLLLAKIGTTDRMYESSDQPESVDDLSAWANSGSGSFESLVNYVNDDALSDVWNTAASSEMAQMMAGMFGVNVTDGASLKAMFANMASAPANNGSQIYQIKFGYDCKTIYFCDQDGNVIESHPYTFVESNNSLGMLAGETTYVFKADDDAGVLTYIAMLKPHFDEGMDETTMPAHVHFYYAETKDTLGTYKPDSVMLSSWMPTMLQMGDEFSTADKVAMLECLFGINNADEEQATDIGILVVAHGSDENWNQRVRESVAEVEVPYPVELGFLDVETENIAMAVQALEEKGVKRIVAVPIFVCSASSHMEEIKYMLGLPSSLDDAAAQEEGLERIEKTATVELTSALDDHLLIAEILDERLKNLSQDAEKEIVVLVAHGTSNPENLAVWKEKMASLGDKLQQIQGFKQVCYGFVGAGTPDIRTVVEEVKNNNPDCTVIVMPVMLSEGVYTDSKIPTSLEGITYLYPEAGQRALLPHANMAQYIAFRANDAVMGDIKLQESGQSHVVQYSDVALEEGGKVCVCGSFAYRAMQEALEVLSPGAVAECSRFTAVGPNSEGTEAALQTILGTGRYRLEERPHNEDYYSYQITDHDSGRVLTVKARSEVFPENFFALKNKIKDNTATSEEKKTFQALRAQVVEKLRWEDAGNLLIIEENIVFAGGSGVESDPYRIATAEQLDQIRNHLDKNFILTADIDLAGYENWEPIGMFQPASSAQEDAENPDPEVAFTGNFDGNGYTISNVTINQSEGIAVGLFGCAAGKEENFCSIYDLTVENVNVTGNMLTGGVVGFQYSNCTLENISLTGSNTVQGNEMVGGITGGGFGDLIDCNAVADITILGDSRSHAGVLGGGLEGCSVTGCTAKGTVTAENDNCFGLGGLAGCLMDGLEIRDCHAEVEIRAPGEDNLMVGGLLGHTGTYDANTPTLVTNCSADTMITVSNSAVRVGGLVGGGFYHERYKSERPVPTSYRITNCSTSGTITGGSKVGSIAGYAYYSTVENCTSKLKWTCHRKVKQVGYFENSANKSFCEQQGHRTRSTSYDEGRADIKGCDTTRTSI